MVGQSHIVDLCDIFMGTKPFCNFHGIFLLLFKAYPSVFIPLKISQLSKGDSTAPSDFWISFILSASSSSLTTTRPAKVSLCPRDISFRCEPQYPPQLQGPLKIRCKKVLSTIKSIFLSFANRDIVFKSATFIIGLWGLNKKRLCVLFHSFFYVLNPACVDIGKFQTVFLYISSNSL